VLNPVLANLLDATNTELSEDFQGTLLLLYLKSVECVINGTHVVLLDLLSLKLVNTLLFLLELLVSPVLHLSFTVLSQILLCISHGFLNLLYFSDFIIELSSNFIKDADTLLVGSG